VSKASWLWPYCCRKGAERPDLQQCKLPVKEGSKATWHTICELTVALLLYERSRATWRTTVQTTSEGREQSDLTHNSANYQWRKGAKRPDVQFTNWLWPYCCRKGAEWPDAQQCKLPVKEGSRATWRTIFLTMSQTVVEREQSDLIDNTICSCTDCWWKGAKRPHGQHYLQLHRPLLEGSKTTSWTTLSAAAQTVVGRKRSGLTSTQT